MGVVVSDVPEDGVDGGELEVAAVVRELKVRLVGGRVPANRNVVVRQRLGGLLNIRIEQHRRGGRGAGARAEAEE